MSVASESAQLGSALTSILSDLSGRVSELKTLCELRGLAQTEAGLSALSTAELQISAIEHEVACARAELAREQAALDAARQLQKEATATTESLAHMASHMPAVLPGDNQLQGGEDAAGKGSASEPPAPAPAAAPEPAQARSALPGLLPPLPLVTEKELSSAPSYMRSRLDVGKVNAALLEMNKTLGAKYALLMTAPAGVRSLSDAERRRYHELKKLDEALPGVVFLSEDDLRPLAHLRQDSATGKNILAVLRHVGRFKEFQHAGMRCYSVRAQPSKK